MQWAPCLKVQLAKSLLNHIFETNTLKKQVGKNLSFSNGHTPFTLELKKKVEAYFTENNIKPTGTWKLYSKTLLLCGFAVFTYIILLSGIAPSWVNVIFCVLMGLNFAAIGFNVMHDGAHGSYSSKKWVNDLMSYSLNALGGSSFLWKVKHNVMHHAYTNIEGHDDDIDIKPLIRTNTHQPRYWYHSYQHIYSFILYTTTYIIWIAFRDFSKYFSGKVSNRKFAKMKTHEHIGFWTSKVLYAMAFLVIPIALVGWAHALIGYLIICGVCGLVLSIVFQLAHVVEDSDFPIPDEDSHKIESNWFVHQLSTTANFATKSKLVSWFVGGLNFQVEHHLFPKISHIHYPAINKLVKELCAKYEVKYIEYPTLFRAIRAHVSHLRIVGAA
jgi:linoleoyl-CoA desaturase